MKTKPICRKHPKYKAIRKPKAFCPDCLLMWEAKQPKQDKTECEHCEKEFCGVVHICKD